MLDFLNKILYNITYAATVNMDGMLPDNISKQSVTINNPDSFVITFIKPIMTFLVYLVGSLAFFALIIAGIMYITAGYNEGNKKQAINIIKYTILAIITVILSYTIVSIIVNFF